MRFLTPKDVDNVFGELGFWVSLKQIEYRSALVLEAKVAATQTRIGASPPSHIGQIIHFTRALNRWLPTERSRLLWIDHWELGTYAADDALLLAARNGLGEPRPLADAPGHFFGAHRYDEEDQFEVSPEQSRDMALLSGLISLVMITQSDGWLIAEGCTDRVEFWEGHLFFHAHDPARLQAADAILDAFACPRTLK